MKGISVKRLFGSHEDAEDPGLIGGLYELDQKFQRMYVGIVMFLLETCPEFWRKVLRWIKDVSEFVIRVVVRLCRIGALGAGLLLIVFGPVAVVPGWFSGGWMIVSLIGCIYGLIRKPKQRKATSVSPLSIVPRQA